MVTSQETMPNTKTTETMVRLEVMAKSKAEETVVTFYFK